MTSVLAATRPKCSAKKRQGKGCCMRPAGWATDHPGVGRCKLHGGCTPNHRIRAQREMAKQQQPAEVIPAGAVPPGSQLDVQLVTGPRAEVSPEGARLLLSVMETAELRMRHEGSAPPAGWHEIYEVLSEVAAVSP